MVKILDPLALFHKQINMYQQSDKRLDYLLYVQVALYPIADTLPIIWPFAHIKHELHGVSIQLCSFDRALQI